jgi:2-polyprenyl-3-methyl-5-hydroxy-6-metoxy-1,4-benzoquinol methylase
LTASWPCVACGGVSSDDGFAALGLDAGSPPFRVVRCASCGCASTVPALPETEIGAWYPPAYYGKENVRFNPVFERLVRWFRLRRARVIARREPPGPVLDVGCGRGMMLSYLRELGFEPHGVELSDEAAWHARTRLGLPVEVGNFLDAYQPGQFQAIVFWHSLEHMRDPAAALRHAHALLKRGGLLVVAVPNSDSLQARLFGANWFHLDVPRHYHHLGGQSLRTMLGKLGFRVVQEDHFSLEQNPYGWLQSFFNALGFEFNLLYSMIKNPSSRQIEIRRHPLQSVLTVLLLPPLLVLSGALTLLEAALRRGGTVEIYAVKAG